MLLITFCESITRLLYTLIGIAFCLLSNNTIKYNTILLARLLSTTNSYIYTNIIKQQKTTPKYIFFFDFQIDFLYK